MAKVAEGESMAARKSKTGSKAKAEWERTPREVEAIKKALSERAEGVSRLKVSKSEMV